MSARDEKPITSAPWRMLSGGGAIVADHGSRRVVLIGGRDGLRTCDEETLTLRPLRPDDPVGRLIQAAPDLLRELQNVVAQAERWPFLSVGVLVEHHSNIRAVVEKATGATEQLLAEVAQLDPAAEQTPRAFTRRLDRDESGTWIALMAADSDGEVELDRFGVDEDVDSDVAHLNANLDDLRACIHDARHLTGNWTPGRKR